MTAPLSPQVQEWRAEAERLAMNLAHVYSFVGCDAMPNALQELRAHLDAVPFNQVPQEPPAQWLFIQLGEGTDANTISWCADDAAVLGAVKKALFCYPEGEQWDPEHLEQAKGTAENLLRDGAVDFEGDPGIRLYRAALAASPQPVRGEALPAEQPKSEIAYPVVAVGSDLPPARPNLRRAAFSLYVPPFYFRRGYVWDSNNLVVADDDAVDVVARIRGWGHISYLPEAEALQDEVGAMVAEALTAYWDQRSGAPCEASAGEVPSNKKAPESSSAAPVEAVEVQPPEPAKLYAERHRLAVTEDWCMGWDACRNELVAQPPQAVQEVRHVCGLQGFGQSLDDQCPACRAAATTEPKP